MRKLFLIMFSLASVGASADTFPRYTEKEKEAINHCKNLDVKLLEDIKSQMVTSGVFSGVGTASSVVSFSISASNVAGKDDAERVNSKAKNIAGNIAAGVGTGASLLSASFAGTALTKLKGLIDDLEECKEGLGNIADSPENKDDTKTEASSGSTSENKDDTKTEASSGSTSSESSGQKTETTTTTVVTETSK
ncbi:hypothetical protein HDR60_00635 [bacterium]|nr:hypothetical protein [bacterium]